MNEKTVLQTQPAWRHIDDLAQDCGNSIANTLHLR